MTKKETATKSQFLNVLFDTQAGMLLGMGGRWMKPTEFEKNPPQKPEDLVPPGEPSTEDPDPGPIPKCINGQLFVCNGNICTRVIKNGKPVPCP